MSALDAAWKARKQAEGNYLAVAKDEVKSELIAWAQNLFTQAPECDLVNIGVYRDPESGIHLDREYACNQKILLAHLNRILSDETHDGSNPCLIGAHNLAHANTYRDIPRHVYQLESYKGVMWIGAPEGVEWEDWHEKSHVNWLRRHKDAIFQMVDWKVADIWLVSTGEGVVLDIQTWESEW